MSTSKDLLHTAVENETINEEDTIPEDVLKMYEQLLSNQVQENGEVTDNPEFNQISKSVAPTPGCCIKTKNVNTKEKIFINVCTSSNIPAPPKISEEDLKDMIDKLDDDDAVIDYRIPMSIGEPHAEVENKGAGCTAYDIIIHPTFLHTINNSKIFFGFFMSVVFEGILNKYRVTLDRNWNVLKKRKFFGSLSEQNVRQRRLIQEMGNTISSSATSNEAEKPDFKIMREPIDGHPEFLIAEIDLPKVERANVISVDVGEDCLAVTARPQLYSLKIFLPFRLIQEECGSQFNVSTKILTITMPVQNPE